MTNEQLAGHLAARYGDPEKYDDLYQEAWVAILEGQERGLDEKAMYWYARTHVSHYKTYKDRMVPLPPRSGNIELAENQEIEHDIQDHLAKTEDHAERYEFKDYLMYLIKKVPELSFKDRQILDQVYFKGKTFSQIANETGTSYQLWQQRHNAAINNLRKLVDE